MPANPFPTYGASPYNFISSVNNFHDLQRYSRFHAYIKNIPSCCDEIYPIGGALFLRCEAVDLPGKSLETFNHRTYGPILKYPMQTTFPDITLTFILSANMTKTKLTTPGMLTGGQGFGDVMPNTGMGEKRIFENWINYINPYPTNTPRLDYAYHNFKYREEYAATITVQCYDNDDQGSFTMEFYSAYPTMIGQIGMNWASEEVVRMPVTFTYQHFSYTNHCDCPPNSQDAEQAPITTQEPRGSIGGDNWTPNPLWRRVPQPPRNQNPGRVTGPQVEPRQLPQTNRQQLPAPNQNRLPAPRQPLALPPPTTVPESNRLPAPRQPLALPPPQRPPLALPAPQQQPSFLQRAGRAALSLATRGRVRP